MKTRLKPWLKHVPSVIGVALLIMAILVTRRVFHHLNLADVHMALDRLPAPLMIRAFAGAVASYAVLTLYDQLANYWVGSKIAFWKITFTSFCAYALSHNLGFSTVSGGAVRYRLYAHFGLTPLQIAKVVAFCGLSFGLGGMFVGGVILITEPGAVPFFGDQIPHYLLRALGIALWGVDAAYLLASRVTKTIRVFGRRVELPGCRIALAQVAIAVMDVTASSSVIFWLLPPIAGFHYWQYLAIYLACYSAGLTSNLPGGIGVFDTTMLLSLSRVVDAPIAASAILVFRLYYYIIPLFVAGSLFAGNEILLRGRALLRPAGQRPNGTGPRFSEPDFAAAAATGVVALCGLLLLALPVIGLRPPDFSFVDPDFNSFTAQAGQYVPSLMGTSLLLLAMGLSRRVRLAWWATMALLLSAAGFTAAQGITLWLPALLALAVLLVAPFRAAFYRRSSLLTGTMQPGTAFSLLIFMLCVLALALFLPTVRDMEKTSWWDVVLSPDLPPPIRVTMALAVLVALIAAWRLLRPGRTQVLPWDTLSRKQYCAFGGGIPPEADGAVLGENGRALLPFKRVDSILLGLGDPVGAANDRVSAIWRLRDLAQQESRDPAMWRVGPELLPIYADLGLNAVPLGDDGGVSAQAEAEIDHPHVYVCAANERDFHLLRPLLPVAQVP